MKQPFSEQVVLLAHEQYRDAVTPEEQLVVISNWAMAASALLGVLASTLSIGKAGGFYADDDVLKAVLSDVGAMTERANADIRAATMDEARRDAETIQ